MLDRVRSMSAGLETSTVTPGRTAADASRTTPAMLAWAYARAGRNTNRTRAPTTFTTRCITQPPMTFRCSATGDTGRPWVTTIAGETDDENGGEATTGRPATSRVTAR